METKFNVVPKKELFIIKTKNGDVVANADTVKDYKTWRAYMIIGQPVSIGEAGPDDVLVRCTVRESRMCYSSARYEISSATKLSEFDLECIRQRYEFLFGQETAVVRNMTPVEENGRYIYNAFSICDSSD